MSRVIQLSERGKAYQEPKQAYLDYFSRTKECGNCKSQIALDPLLDVKMRYVPAGYDYSEWRLTWNCPVCYHENSEDRSEVLHKGYYLNGGEDEKRFPVGFVIVVLFVLSFPVVWTLGAFVL